MISPRQQAALDEIAAAAVIAERVTGCPAELSVAQCILESDWLLRAPGNNAFGIKATDSNAQYQLTKEYIDGSYVTQTAAFETYPTLMDGFIAHARLLTDGKPYAAAWEHYRDDPKHDLDTLIGSVARRYATDPKYTINVIALAHGPNVTAAIARARVAAPVTV